MMENTRKLPSISSRAQSATVSLIKEMVVLAQDYPNAISLAQGTPSFLTPSHIRERVKKELDENPKIGKYGTPFTGLKELKEAIGEKLRNKYGIEADTTREVYVTVGAMEGVAHAIFTVVDPGDEVILFCPSFASHIEQVRLAGGIPVFVPLDEERGWAVDIRAFQSAITKKTKALVIASPTNPTGTIFRRAEIEEVARLGEEHNFWIITDEPYSFLAFDGKEIFSPVQLPEIRDRRIACFSFSKEFAMSGFRVGYVYAPERVMRHMVKIHDAVNVTVSTISQYAAIQALQGPRDAVEYFKQEFAKRRELTCRRLERLNDLFSFHKPEGALYVFPKIKIPIDDYTLALRFLREAEVVVVPGQAFGPQGAGHIRFCFAMSEEEINEGFDRIERWWHAHKSEFS